MPRAAPTRRLEWGELSGEVDIRRLRLSENVVPILPLPGPEVLEREDDRAHVFLLVRQLREGVLGEIGLALRHLLPRLSEVGVDASLVVADWLVQPNASAALGMLAPAATSSQNFACERASIAERAAWPCRRRGVLGETLETGWLFVSSDFCVGIEGGWRK